MRFRLFPLKNVLRSSRYRRLAKEGGWLVAGQIAVVAGSLFSVRIITEFLDPEQYGQLALGLTVAVLVNNVAMGGVAAGIGRFYSVAVEQNDLHGFLHASKILVGYAIFAVAIIGLLLIGYLYFDGKHEWLGLMSAVLVFSVLSGISWNLSSVQNAARQRSIVAIHSSLTAWLKTLFAVGVMLLLGNSGTAIVIGYSIASLIVISSQLFLSRRMFFPSFEFPRTVEKWRAQIWSYSWPFSAWGFFAWGQMVSDRWALEAFASTQEVGLYVVVFQLGYLPIGLVMGILASFIEPILYQRSGGATNPDRNKSVHQIVWRISNVGLLITAFGFFIAILLHEFIFAVMASSEFQTGSYLLPWMILAGGIFAVSQIISLKLMSELKTSTIATAKIVTAIIGVGLNVYGASEFGLNGLVSALVIFSCIQFFSMAWLARAI